MYYSSDEMLIIKDFVANQIEHLMAPPSAARLVTRRPPSRLVRLRSNERLPCLRCISRCIEEPLFRGTLCSTDNPSTRRPCRVFPRRKAGEASRASSEPIVVTRKTIAAFFDRPLRQASIDLGISPTALKSLCRKLEVALRPFILNAARARWWMATRMHLAGGKGVGL